MGKQGKNNGLALAGFGEKRRSKFLEEKYENEPSMFDYQLSNVVFVLGMIEQLNFISAQLQLHIDWLRNRKSN